MGLDRGESTKFQHLRVSWKRETTATGWKEVGETVTHSVTRRTPRVDEPGEEEGEAEGGMDTGTFHSVGGGSAGVGRE